MKPKLTHQIYMETNLKLQRVRIILSTVSIIVAIAIFIFWVTR